jgi:hypothetical protein
MIVNYLKKLESFSLVDLPLKNSTIKKISELLKISNIKKLSFVNCFQKKEDISPLIPYFSSNIITSIDLSNHNFNILSSLKNSILNYDLNKKLTSINFSNCKLTDEDIISISNYIVASPSLLFCDISKNILSTKACSQFGYCISKTTSLETLKMSECSINPESLLFLFNGKGSKSLKYVNLNENDFGDIGLVSVSAFIKNAPNLEKIEVKKCKGTDMGIVTLVNSIKIINNSKLKCINYQGNNITQIALAVLKNSNELFKKKGIFFVLNRIEGETENNIDCIKFS